jgi:predicted methyltransferase
MSNLMKLVCVAMVCATVVQAPAIARRQASAPQRPADDVARDAARKPKEMIAFAGIKRGQKVADFLPGGGYFTRIFAIATGPTGKVYAVVPKEDPGGTKAMEALVAQPGNRNISLVSDLTSITPAAGLDVVWTAQNYHDLHIGLPAEVVAGFNASVFAALKPGGVFVVVDHAANPGSDAAAIEKLHRIDPEMVKSEVLAAGFVLDGETMALRNPADDHSKTAFDPAISSKTDQFVLRFRKPLKP